MTTSIYDVPVFIINMPNRKDRKEHMINLMKELGFKNYTFIEPFKANDITIYKLEIEIEQKYKKNYSRASHTLTYIELLKLNFDKIIIMEDDIIISKTLEEIKKNLEYIFQNHPKNSDMIYMEMCYEKCNFNKDGNFIKLENPLCLASVYYPSKISRDKILNELKNFKFLGEDIDQFFSYMINKGKINAYMYDMLFFQNNKFGSELEGSLGYGEDIRPPSPMCKDINKIPIVLKNNRYNQNIIDMYNSYYKFNKFNRKILFIPLIFIIIIFIIFIVVKLINK